MVLTIFSLKKENKSLELVKDLLKKPLIKDFNKNQYLNTSPSSPPPPTHPLTNFEIQISYYNGPRFSGVYSRDNLPNKIEDGK